MRVFVKNQRNEPLMPCSNQKARQLIKQNKAKIVRYNPFTIQLLYPTGETTQPVGVGIDTGAKYVGIAIASENKVLAKGEVELRQDISAFMETRAVLRGSRRSRKTRYRQARWLNRKHYSGWLPPSVKSKLDATFMWIDRFCELVPRPRLSIEVGKFDVAKMINPDIQGEDYQNGDGHGYYDVRYFVFARDNYTCQVCKKKNKIFNTHHILYRSKGGTDRASNLITVCTDCHTSENHKEGHILYNWMLKNKKVRQYKDATFMNIVRKRTIARYRNARITYGSETSPRRKELTLSKTHYNDAIAISGVKYILSDEGDYFYYKQFRKKKRSLHESVPRKYRKLKNIGSVRSVKNIKFRNGFYLNDMVRFLGKLCWVFGFSGGDKSAECVLRDLNGDIVKMPSRANSLSVNMKEVAFCSHNNNWQYNILPQH